MLSGSSSSNNAGSSSSRFGKTRVMLFRNSCCLSVISVNTKNATIQ